nr:MULTISPECIES: NUDIX domain-containing protein [unclassified Frigoribacterium]
MRRLPLAGARGASAGPAGTQEARTRHGALGRPRGQARAGEGVQEAVVREIAEESGVEVLASDLDRRGDLLYLFPHRESWSQRSTVFVVTAWRGDPAESDELVPRWFDLDELPLDEMWDDASHWLPGVLAGGRVARTFVFAADLATVASDAPLPPEHAGP